MSISAIHTRPAPLLALCLAFGGCTQVPAGPLEPFWPGAPTAANYDFSWRLSGHRDLAPLQVFDDGRDTWLQFPSLQATPAIFIEEGNGARLAAHAPAGPYVKVQGVWRALAFRGGSRQARAEYIGSNRQNSTVMAGRGAAAAGDSGNALATYSAGPGDAMMPATPLSVMDGAPAHSAILATSDAPGYAASPADGNMRRALARWASQAGWTFETQHWSVAIDIPLAGSAAFGNDFVQAVRQLLAATELSGQPLQPCFYSNKVLRVVAWAQACGRGWDDAGGLA